MLFGKLKKFPYKGLFPFERFPFYDYELYHQALDKHGRKAYSILLESATHKYTLSSIYAVFVYTNFHLREFGFGSTPLFTH